MFFTGYSWLCAIFGHKFQKINDLRMTALRRERVVYRCKRCNYTLIKREKDRRQGDRRTDERRQARYFQDPTLKYTS
jgi:hypothetical protein